MATVITKRPLIVVVILRVSRSLFDNCPRVLYCFLVIATFIVAKENFMKSRHTRKQAINLLIGMAGLALTGYMLKVLGDNGLYADAHQTSAYGWYTPLEWGAALLGVILVIISLILLLRNAGKSK